MILTIFSFTASGGERPERKDRRIGIIGAGASGLTASYFLKKKGFNNVTVLEKNSRVGGKGHTITYMGQRYELGSIMTGPSYKTVNDLGRVFKQRIVPFSEKHGVEYSPSQKLLRNIDFKRKGLYFLAALEYWKLYAAYGESLEKPGHAAIPSELQVPFRVWARENAWLGKEMEEMLSHFFVAFGYGYLDSVPAVYVLKYFSPRLLFSFLSNDIQMFENGYQSLWEAMAKEVSVELNSEVVSAANIQGEWIVRLAGGKERKFDDLIITIPLDAAAKMIEMPSELSAVFNQIQYESFQTVLVDIDMKTLSNGVVTENYDSGKKGSIVSWLFSRKNSSVAAVYRLGGAGGAFEKEAASYGWKVNKVIQTHEWRYFPHFSSEALNKSPYKIIESYQSLNSLFFAGEIMSFSTVEHSAAYSKDLVERFF